MSDPLALPTGVSSGSAIRGVGSRGKPCVHPRCRGGGWSRERAGEVARAVRWVEPASVGGERAGPARGAGLARSRPLAGCGAVAAPLPGGGGGRASGGGLDCLKTDGWTDGGPNCRPRSRRLLSVCAGPRYGRLARLGQRQPAEVQ